MIAVEDPATGETLAEVPDLDRSDDRGDRRGRPRRPARLVAAGFDERARVLMAARAWLVANGDRVVETICGETGKPADETMFAELCYGVSALEFWAKNAPTMLADEIVETASPFIRGGRRAQGPLRAARRGRR